jgi:hypothetical protein
MPSEPLYHTGEQHAEALLAPIARALDVLAVRAGHHATRLRLSEGDRELIEMAQRILANARDDVAGLLTHPGVRSGGGR